MHMRRIRRQTWTLFAVAALLVSACSTGGSTSAASSSADTGSAGLAPYYAQKLSWRSCGVGGFECATMRAPRDYAAPSEGDVRLAVSRQKATGAGEALGSLLVN